MLSAAALTIGKRLFPGGYHGDGAVPGTAVEGAGSVWSDFGNNLQQFGTNAAIGAVSSYLAAEFGQSLGLHGFAGDAFTAVTGNVLQTIASNPSAILANAHGLSNLGGALETGVASFVGQQLASLIVQPPTVAESTLASLGSAVGAYFGAKGAAIGLGLGGPPGAAIGAFIGFIIGDLIGSLFGHHKPRVPSAFAETVLQIPFAQYGLGAESSSNGGDLGFADGMAKAARDTLNGIIAQVTGKPVGASFVANGYSPTQTYGYNGGQIYVKLGGAQNNVSSADQAVDKGVLWALPQTKIIGGDLFLKRAIQNGQWQSVTELLGDLQIASDYEQYLKNAPVIDAAIASSWNGLSQGDKDFYSANQAFMTRAISASELPLTGGDVGFYDANRGQVDRIVAGVSVSSFAAGWITTIARASELGLGDFSPSDFYGGLQGFVQSFGVAATGTADHYEDFRFVLHRDGSAGITSYGAASAGTFGVLPQHYSSAPGNDLFNPRFQDGIATWDYGSNWGSANNSVNLPGWSGSGNDVAWSVMHGTPPAGYVFDYYSDHILSTAGHLYEASVWAAEHRGVARLWMEFDDANRVPLGYTLLASGGREDWTRTRRPQPRRLWTEADATRSLRLKRDRSFSSGWGTERGSHAQSS